MEICMVNQHRDTITIITIIILHSNTLTTTYISSRNLSDNDSGMHSKAAKIRISLITLKANPIDSSMASTILNPLIGYSSRYSIISNNRIEVMAKVIIFIAALALTTKVRGVYMGVIGGGIVLTD